MIIHGRMWYPIVIPIDTIAFKSKPISEKPFTPKQTKIWVPVYMIIINYYYKHIKNYTKFINVKCCEILTSSASFWNSA